MAPKLTARARTNREPTIKEVAARAGVSVATVSRVFNRTGPVAEATWERVLSVAQDLAYVPHGAARSLSMRRTNTIEVVLPDLYGEFFHRGERPRPAKAFDPPVEQGGGNVMLCSSFTKALAPGMRIGWVVAGRWQREIERLKFINTYSTPLALQQTIARFLDNGGYDHHLRRLRRIVSEQVTAAVEACRLRLRPILMTSLAFTFGVVPLYVATGAGAEMRVALGTAVFWGMIGVTLFGLIFTPIFYVIVRALTSRLRRRRGKTAAQVAPAE